MTVSRWLPAATLVAGFFFASACGGKTTGGSGGDGGSSSSSGSSSGGGDGGNTCKPLPGCTSTTSCPATDGCNTCDCVDGDWECGDLGCVADASVDVQTTCPASNDGLDGTACPVDGQDCPPPGGGCGLSCDCENGTWRCVAPPCPPPTDVCPAAPPTPGTSCTLDNLQCSWPSAEGCSGQTCDCQNGEWSCSGETCPVSACPDNEPAQQSLCMSVGQICNYVGDAACDNPQCTCDPSGTWDCELVGCGGGNGDE
jgi:hypothetical protein